MENRKSLLYKVTITLQDKEDGTISISWKFNPELDMKEDEVTSPALQAGLEALEAIRKMGEDQ